MSARDGFEAVLREYLDGSDIGMADAAHEQAIEAIRARRQRPRWLARVRLDIGGGVPHAAAATGATGIRRLVRSPVSWAFVALIAVSAAGAVAVSVLPRLPAGNVIGPGPSATIQVVASPAPSATPTGTKAAPDLQGLVVMEDLPAAPLVAGLQITSDRFQPRVTFQLLDRRPGSGEPDVCPPPYTSTSPGMIVLAHPKGCVEDIRLIHPYAVECGDLGTTVDADRLATSILNKLGSYAKDRGSLEAPGAVPAGLFVTSMPGRVLEIEGRREFEPRIDDPDRCRLLTGPGVDDPVVEIRGDTAAKLVLVDAGGQLVVLRIGLEGHDAGSSAEARSRGYGGRGWDHLLSVIHDIDFSRRDGP